MIHHLSAAAASGVPAVNLTALLSGGGGSLLVAILIYVGKLMLDRAVPSRSDSRASQSLVLDSLSTTIKVLQDEKIADAARVESKQTRIDSLEESSNQDWDLIQELRGEISELRNRLAVKDRHIRILVLELRRLGAQVSGLSEDIPIEELEITMSPEEVAEKRTQSELDK